MAQQVIESSEWDYPPVKGYREARHKINENFEELYQQQAASLVTPAYVQFVDTNGSDANNGKTLATAKLTFQAAAAALPTSGGKPVGKITLGRGDFTITAKTVVGGGLMIEGMGTGTSGTGSSNLVLGANVNDHILECTNLASQNHGLFLRNFGLKGNKANNSTSADAHLILLAGGFGVRADNLSLADAIKWGIKVGGGYQTIKLTNITSSDCGSTTQGGFLFCDQTQSGGCFSLETAQIDKSGVNPIFIQYGTDGEGHMFEFNNIKMENQGNIALHEKCIVFSPRLTGTGNKVFIQVRNSFFYNNNATADLYTAPLFENNESGLGACWDIQNVEAGSQYLVAFNSAKTGRASEGKTIRKLIEQPQTSTIPYMEMNGTWHFVHSVSPESVIAAPVGSTCLARNGSSLATTRFTKCSGTGNTGWLGG